MTHKYNKITRILVLINIIISEHCSYLTSTQDLQKMLMDSSLSLGLLVILAVDAHLRPVDVSDSKDTTMIAPTYSNGYFHQSPIINTTT